MLVSIGIVLVEHRKDCRTGTEVGKMHRRKDIRYTERTTTIDDGQHVSTFDHIYVYIDGSLQQITTW